MRAQSGRFDYAIIANSLWLARRNQLVDAMSNDHGLLTRLTLMEPDHSRP